MASGVDGRHTVLLGTLVTGSSTCLYHYLRIIVAIAAPAGPVPGDRARSRREIRGERPGHAVLAALVLLLMGLGTYPAPLLTLIRAGTSMVAR